MIHDYNDSIQQRHFGVKKKSLCSSAILFSIFSYKRKTAEEIETNSYHHKSPFFYYDLHITVFIRINLFFNFKQVIIQNVLCKIPILLKNTCIILEEAVLIWNPALTY